MVALCGAVAVTNARMFQTRLLATGLELRRGDPRRDAASHALRGLAVAGFAVLLMSGMVGHECVKTRLA